MPESVVPPVTTRSLQEETQMSPSHDTSMQEGQGSSSSELRTFGPLPTKPTNRRARFDIRDQEEIGFELAFERAVKDSELKTGSVQLPIQVERIRLPQPASCYCSRPPTVASLPAKRHGVEVDPPCVEEISQHFTTLEPERVRRRYRATAKATRKVTLTSRVCCCWCKHEVDEEGDSTVNGNVRGTILSVYSGRMNQRWAPHA